jgi:hypothetical protein
MFVHSSEMSLDAGRKLVAGEKAGGFISHEEISDCRLAEDNVYCKSSVERYHYNITDFNTWGLR